MNKQTAIVVGVAGAYILGSKIKHLATKHVLNTQIGLLKSQIDLNNFALAEFEKLVPVEETDRIINDIKFLGLTSSMK